MSILAFFKGRILREEVLDLGGVMFWVLGTCCQERLHCTHPQPLGREAVVSPCPGLAIIGHCH